MKPSQLFIAADGPRSNRLDEAQKCKEVRDIVKAVDWECELHTRFSDTNLGLKIAVSSAITWFFEHVESGIILEDDCLPTRSFFNFCKIMLEKYRDDDRIFHITGNNFQFGTYYGESSYYFSKIPAIWGWATWRRAWNFFDGDVTTFEAFKEQRIIENIFPNKNTQRFWLDKIEATKRGNDSWGFPWVYTVLSNNGLCITPNHNLVSNCGFGPDAVHATDPTSRFSNIPVEELGDLKHPLFPIPNVDADDKFTALLSSEQMVFPNMAARFKHIARQSLGDKKYESLKAFLK